MNHNFKTGDRVAYTRDFCKCAGHELAFMRGNVLKTETLGKELLLVEVNWGNGDIRKILNKNLIHAKQIHLEPV